MIILLCNLTPSIWLECVVLVNVVMENDPYINSSSKLTLKVLYKQSGATTFTEIPALAKTYTFNDTRWYGYDINGKSIEYTSRYDSRFRYYDFVFKPKDITISNGTEAFAQICSIFNKW